MYHGGRLMNLTAATLTIGTAMTLFSIAPLGAHSPNSPPSINTYDFTKP